MTKKTFKGDIILLIIQVYCVSQLYLLFGNDIEQTAKTYKMTLASELWLKYPSQAWAIKAGLLNDL
jgi:hypothetical protein